MDAIEMINLAHQGDKDARDRLVTENVGLIWSIVKRFGNRNYEMEDLFQIGCIGMIKAIDKFDCSYDVKLSTYAVPMIAGEIKRFLRDDGMIKVSRTLKENGYKIRQVQEKLSQEYGREATIEEIAEKMELTREEVVMTMDANAEVESIYKTVYQSDGSEMYLMDKMGNKDKGVVANLNLINGDGEKEKLLNHLMVKQMIEELSERDRELIILRYYQDKTQTEVAKILGISQVQVSRIEKKILLGMRSRM
ncbi:MAG: SigF/SigG family RNA polymerase sporulation sigma factor [Lachnospiraceae bacterium]|nr:SigF/SigG family RNA polymerase sporulation sigma factor [Lachnospiraceae bacterium]